MALQLTVGLGERSYPIIIASNLLACSEYYEAIKGNRAFIVTNETVAPYYLSCVTDVLVKRNIIVDTIVLPDGEQYKSLTVLNLIFTELLQKNHGRDTTLIALGGGVIGDLAGFAAACYQRGIPFIQVPTTLLAQVDSSVGGKTAVNHTLGKNMIGAFYQPKSVIIDVNCLKTLPQREFSSGLAEVIKYGIILDTAFFSWLEENIDLLLQLDERALTYCIARCCQLKADIVANDEKEHGCRALLNLGHTFGHAIETKMGYGCWLHGEAVAIGMLMAAKTAQLIGTFSEKDFNRIKKLLIRAKLPVARPEEMSSDSYLPYMLRDKKVQGGKLRLILPVSIGHAKINDDIDIKTLLIAINAC